MDYLEFLAVIIPVVGLFYLLTKWINLADARARFDLETSRKKSLMNAANARMKTNPGRNGRTPEPVVSPNQVGAWVEELADLTGFDVDQIFQDEVPEQVEKLLSNPMVKGFVGNLTKRAGESDKQQDITTIGY